MAKKGQPENPIETYVEKVVKKILTSEQEKIKKKDAEEIVKAIMPEIEKLVSKTVIKHLKIITKYIQNNFRDPEET